MPPKTSSTQHRMRNCMVTAWKILNDKWYLNPKVKYAIWQEEECPTSKKKHYQIYVEFKDGVSIDCVKCIFDDDTIHVEPRKGNQSQAIAYCSKTETRIAGPWTYGSKGQQGYRSDLDSIMDAIEDNRTAREILIEYRGNAIRHISSISRALSIFHEFENDGRLDRLITRRRGGLGYTRVNPSENIDNIYTEVEGNTISSTSNFENIPMTDSVYEISDDEDDEFKINYVCGRCGIKDSHCECKDIGERKEKPKKRK